MIKVGILGASVPQAGELIRLLVNHPEVELEFAYDTRNAGVSMSHLHHGLIGETELKVTDTPQLARLDAAIICEESDLARKIALNPDLYPRMKVIDMTGKYGREEESEMILGLSEVNRKPLVRGATRSVLMPTLPTIAAIALYPFASSLLINGDVSIAVSGRYEGDPESDARQLSDYLRGVQNSFKSKITIQLEERSEKGYGRGTRARISFPCTLRIEDAAALYDPVYDDHNFTFVAPHAVELPEVEGTQKCVIALEKPDEETLILDITGDGVMRGGAGDAVHVLNLLFALHEKTGLTLKAVNF